MARFKLFQGKERNSAAEQKAFSFSRSVNVTGGGSTPFNTHCDPITNSVVVSAIKWASRAYVEAPLIVQTFKDGKYETVPNHKALELLKNPNPFTSGTALFSAVITSLMLDGNAYIIKVRNSIGIVTELWYVPHTQISPATDRSNPELFISHYEYKVNGTTFNLSASDVIHFKDGVNIQNPRLGFSGLSSVMREILTDNEASIYTYTILKNFGITGMTVAPKGDALIAEDDAQIIKQKLAQQFTGEHRGEPLVLSQAIDITNNSVSPEQMALDKMRSIPEQRICSVLGIPPMILNLASGNEQRTYSNLAESREAAYESWIIPTYRNVSETLNNQYLSEFGDKKTDRIIYDISEIRVLQEDANAYSDRLLRQWQSGAITRAEFRQGLGMQTTPADDIYYFDAAMGSITPTSAKSFVMNEIVNRKLQNTLISGDVDDQTE